MALRWRGDQVKARVRAAARSAIDETNAGAADDAAAAWPVETGLSRASIEILEQAEGTGSVVSGRWGGRELEPSPEYSESSRSRVLFEEIGFEGRPGLNILRTAADRWNRGLAGRIRSRLS